MYSNNGMAWPFHGIHLESFHGIHLEPFHGIHLESTWNHSMESTWNPYGIWIIPWNPLESIWNHSMESTWNPYGIWIIPWNPLESIWNGWNDSMESIWNPAGMVQDSRWNMTIPGGIHRACGIKKWLWPQPKVIPWNPYGMTGGFHGFHMDSTWITWGSVKTSILARGSTGF